MNEHLFKKEIWETILRLNKSWTTKGLIEELKQYFHDDMVAVTPAFNERIVGGDACFQGWKGFYDSTDIISWKEKDPDIRIFGDGFCAIVTYYYDIEFKMNDRLFKEVGRDLFVLIQENKKWLAVADHFSPLPKP